MPARLHRLDFLLRVRGRGHSLGISLAGKKQLQMLEHPRTLLQPRGIEFLRCAHVGHLCFGHSAPTFCGMRAPTPCIHAMAQVPGSLVPAWLGIAGMKAVSHRRRTSAQESVARRTRGRICYASEDFTSSIPGVGPRRHTLEKATTHRHSSSQELTECAWSGTRTGSRYEQ